MKIKAYDPGIKEISINDSDFGARRGKDGTFDVDQKTAKSLIKYGDFHATGLGLATISSQPGYRCGDCNHLGVFRDRCRCSSTNLTKEG